jgi:hypothetical protein
VERIECNSWRLDDVKGIDLGVAAAEGA